MNNLERNCKIISYILTFIVFDIVFISIFDRSMDLAGVSKYVPSFALAFLASTLFFQKFRALFAQAVKISYLFYALDRHIRCTRIC